MIEGDVLERARHNFQARNPRQDRAWCLDSAPVRRTLLILSDRERAEFVEHARYELEAKLRRAAAIAAPIAATHTQTQRQG
jgi:hypothetical protein